MDNKTDVSGYFSNLFTFFEWMLADLACLTVGWFGVVLEGDYGQMFLQCQFNFISYWIMKWGYLCLFELIYDNYTK